MQNIRTTAIANFTLLLLRWNCIKMHISSFRTCRRSRRAQDLYIRILENTGIVVSHHCKDVKLPGGSMGVLRAPYCICASSQHRGAGH